MSSVDRIAILLHQTASCGLRRNVAYQTLTLRHQGKMLAAPTLQSASEASGQGSNPMAVMGRLTIAPNRSLL
jgi:hypothetical protein